MRAIEPIDAQERAGRLFLFFGAEAPDENKSKGNFMKQKIKEALKQGHKKLGLSDEVFERVAASVETFITDESAIEGFVNSESTLSLLRSYQSLNDKVRDLERFVPKPNNTPKVDEPDTDDNPPEPKPDDDKVPAWAQLLLEQNKALAEQNKSFAEKLSAFETAQSQKSAVAALDELKATWDYAKGYPTECEDAYERVMELYEVSGKKWTADELTGRFKEKFNKAVSKKGVDTTKPFQSDGGAGTSEAEKNAAFAEEIRNALGIKGE